MKKTSTFAALAAASALLISGCGGAEPEAAAAPAATSVEELYEAAQDEGQVVIYGPTEDLYAAVYEDFKAAYPGIEIVTSDIFGQELDSRLEGEQIAGGFAADLVHIGVSDVERYKEKDYLTPYRPFGTEELDPAFIGPDEAWSVPSQHLYATAYNTKALSADEVPTTWDDLLAADLSGKIATATPKQSGVTPQVLSAALEEGVIDEAWIDSFKAEAKPKIFPSVANALQATVTGETDLAFVAGYGSYMRQVEQGAPLGFSAMTDGAYFSDVAYGVLDGGPNPNAARLLVAWMFSAEGQASVAKHVFEFGTMPEAPLPAGAEVIGDPVRLPYPGAEGYRSTLQLLSTKF